MAWGPAASSSIVLLLLIVISVSILSSQSDHRNRKFDYGFQVQMEFDLAVGTTGLMVVIESKKPSCGRLKPYTYPMLNLQLGFQGFQTSNHQPESWMREIRTSSSEGGEAGNPVFPTPIGPVICLAWRALPMCRETVKTPSLEVGVYV